MVLLCLLVALQLLSAQAAVSAAASEIAVRVVDAANQPVRAAYVAVVRNDAPWREPAAERLADGEVTFQLSPGTYRLVAGAPGFATYFGDATQVDSTRRAIIHLVRLGTVAGRVVDSGGIPIAGARVGMFWELLSDHPHRLSSLGERHLRGNTFVVTDADGIFELPAAIAKSTFVIVEADGKVPRLIKDVSAGSAAVAAVELQDGGSLKLHMASSRAGWFHLVPAAGEVFTALPPDRAFALWTKRADADVIWRSLPAGKFEVVFEPDDGSGDIAALQTVSIVRGNEGIANVLVPTVSMTDNLAARTVSFLLGGKAVGHDRLTVKRWTSTGAAAAPAHLRQVSGGALLEVRAPCGNGDRFTFESALLIGASSPAPGCADASAATLYDRATLRFKVSALLERPPRVGKATFSDCETRHFVAEIPFAIGDDGTAAVPAPARCVSVRAIAGKFAPVEWPRIELTAGAQRDLGTVALSSAATLLVRVSAADGRPAPGIPVSAARVDDLVPLRNVLDIAAVAPIARGVTDAKGWTSLAGIPAGRFVLVLRADADYPQLSDVVKIIDDSRRTIDIMLEEPGRISVAVERPRGLPVSIAHFELLPLPDNRWPHALAFRARPAADDTGEFKSVPPGRWRITVRGTLAESTLTDLGSAEVTVTPGAVLTQTVPIEAILARGTVTRGAAPVQGILTLRAAGGAARQPLTTKLEADGTFQIAAPAAGDYRAFVAEPGRQTTAARAPIHIGRDAADLAIVLPSGRIEGRVIDQLGEGVRGAHVNAVTRATDAAAYETAEAGAVARGDGSFVIDGVGDGEWSLTASSDRLSSAPIVVALGEGETRTGAILRLRPKTQVAGKVLGPDGPPVAGALVSAVLPPPFSEIAAGLVVRTDENGKFTFSPPPGGPEIANVIVRTSDGVAMAMRMTLTDRLTITIPSNLGAFRFTNAAGQWDRDALAFHALVAPDGGFLNPLAGGAIAADRGGQVLATARLPVQQYRYVIARTRAERALLQSGQGGLLPALRTIHVPANGVAEIDLGDISLH